MFTGLRRNKIEELELSGHASDFRSSRDRRGAADRRVEAAGEFGPLRRLRRGFTRLARRPRPAILLTGLFVLALETSIGLGVHAPVPGNTDEFSYLLAGDTFARGRLTNPTHPLWEHFESYKIIQRPSYQSKHPPGQGLSLAVGQVLFGAPQAGVWSTLAAACAAVCWMLCGWLPGRWALLGALLTVMNATMLRHWGQSYWGGGLAMLGGALVFGALPRWRRRPGAVWAVTLAIGVAVLAVSRPYEGLIAVLPVAIVIVYQAVRGGWFRQGEFWRTTVLPAALVLSAAGGWLGYYNYRVTGSPLRLPDAVWRETYSPYGSLADVLFFWRVSDVPADGPERIIRKPPPVTMWQDWFQASSNLARKLLWQWQFYVAVRLTPALCLLPWAVWCRPSLRFAGGTVGLVLAAMVVLSTHGHAHYIAPVAGLISLLLVAGLRPARCWAVRGRASGRFLVRGLVAVHLGSFACLQLVAWVDARRRPVRRADGLPWARPG